MRIFRRKKAALEAAPAPVSRGAQSVPLYIEPVVLTVEETWEEPDPDQYDHAYQGYLDDLQKPIESIETAIEEKAAVFRCTVERMVEIAPDFFEKALARSAFETGYFIDTDKDHDQ